MPTSEQVWFNAIVNLFEQAPDSVALMDLAKKLGGDESVPPSVKSALRIEYPAYLAEKKAREHEHFHQLGFYRYLNPETYQECGLWQR